MDETIVTIQKVNIVAYLIITGTIFIVFLGQIYLAYLKIKEYNNNINNKEEEQ